MNWELTTPWGLFSIGYFDGFLLWLGVLVITAAFGPISSTRVVTKLWKKEDE